MIDNKVMMDPNPDIHMGGGSTNLLPPAVPQRSAGVNGRPPIAHFNVPARQEITRVNEGTTVSNNKKLNSLMIYQKCNLMKQ